MNSIGRSPEKVEVHSASELHVGRCKETQHDAPSRLYRWGALLQSAKPFYVHTLGASQIDHRSPCENVNH